MDHQEAVKTLASERYLLNEMTDAERDVFEDHFFSCAECADDVRAGARMRDGVRSGLASAAVVPIRRAWRPAVAIPWAAAATLAVVAGYEANTHPTGPDAAHPVALTPITLRAATRGQEPVVTPGPDGVVLLAVDVSGAQAEGRIRYVLRDADGTAVASGEVTAPTAGAPLLLMVPAGLLKPAEHYVLVTQNPGNGALTGEEYRFSFEAR